MELVFATNNGHKLHEIREMAGDRIRIYSLAEAGLSGDIPEDHDTLEKNSSQKAWFVFNNLHRHCFADDTGLEVEALNGAPGVYSARYSRMGNDQYSIMNIAEGNIARLLDDLKGVQNRKARFRTVISLILDGFEYSFEGIVNGTILDEKWGEKGFGYDPVFLPDGYNVSFAQMSLQEKNKISHRSRAMEKLINFLNSKG